MTKPSATKNILRCGLIAMALLIAIPVPVVANAAAATQKDLQVILRTIGFMQNAPSGDAIFAIIYDPNISMSVKEANDLQDILKNGVTDKALTLRPKLISVSNLGIIKNARFIFVTAGMERHYEEIGKLADNNNALTFTLDRSCAEQGHCAVYINASERVEIVINRRAAEESSVEFQPVFLMMITTL